MIGFKPQAEAGALMDYGVDLTDNYFHLASFVDKILKVLHQPNSRLSGP